MHVSRRARQLLAVTVFACSFAVSAAPPVATSSPAPSLFERSQYDSVGVARSTSLWLLAADGTTRALTPRVAGGFDTAASWSPHAMRIAFQRGTLASDAGDRYDIYRMDRDGGHLQQLTSGAGNFVMPAWGPGTRIAFVARYGQHECLGVVEANGRNQQDLFCAPAPATLQQPLWSADGRSLYVGGGHFVGRLGDSWRALAWKVDASTGAATQLASVLLDSPRQVEIAPDGSRALLSDVVPNALQLVDFASHRVATVAYGYAPRWSKDARRIAFSGEVYESSPEFRYYNPLFVMDADGGNVRQLTRARVDNLAYSAAQWSRDGSRLLLNQRTYLDPSLLVPRYSLRLLDVASGRIAALPSGYAAAGAWLER